MMTLGAINALNEMDIKIGQDISLLGFDDLEFFTYLGLDISVVTRQTSEMGKIAFYAKIKDYSEYRRGDCRELLCDDGKKDKMYLRFELEEFIKVGPISTVEFGLRGIYYTTLFLLKNAGTVHELFMNSRREIDVDKIAKKISEDTNIKLKKEKDRFYLGKDFIRVLENGSIKFNDNIITFEKLKIALKKTNYKP